MKTILYLGNHLSRNGGYPSVAESLAPRLLPDIRLRLVSRRRNRIRRLGEMLWAVLRYGRREQPVVIDVYSTLGFYYALACGGLCQWLGIRYYCVLHGGNLPARLQRSPQLCRWLFGKASRLIAPSAYLQAAFQQAGYAAEIIPNFIPLANYSFKERPPLRPRLLWVRAFDATYNPAMAIQVLHTLLQQYPNATLCMVGPDKDGSRAACERLAQELGLTDRVRFTGQLSKQEWIALSADYDIFINTTNFDNTPVSVIEAMALGLPVVSTNVGGIPYLITHEEEGLLVEKDDVAGMTAAIVRLLREEVLATRLAKQAREKAEHFDTERIVAQWKKLLHNT